MTQLEFDVTTQLSPQRAWQAWSTDTGLATWFWPQWPDTDYRFNPETERHYRIASDSVGVGVGGEFTHVDPGKRLEFTWCWEDGDAVEAPQPVTVTLTPDGDGTRCVVTHECTPEDEAGLRQGWGDVLERFSALS